MRGHHVAVDLQHDRGDLIRLSRGVGLSMSKRPGELSRHSLPLAGARLRGSAAEVHDSGDAPDDLGAEQLGAWRECRLRGPEQPVLVPSQTRVQKRLDQAIDPLITNLRGKINRVRYQGDVTVAAARPIEVQITRLVLALEVLP